MIQRLGDSIQSISHPKNEFGLAQFKAGADYEFTLFRRNTFCVLIWRVIHHRDAFTEDRLTGCRSTLRSFRAAQMSFSSRRTASMGIMAATALPRTVISTFSLVETTRSIS